MPGNSKTNIEKELLEHFLDSLDRLVPAEQRKQPWIAGLSGGPDSAALCLLLCAAKATGRGKGIIQGRVAALHVNHGLRGRESDEDENVSRSLAGKLGLEFLCKRIVPPQKKSMGSVEAWARSVRYKAFEEKAKETGAGVVLTGHQKDDQAETVMQRLSRGSEYRGLAGIPEARPLGGLQGVLLVRPLLRFSRSRIERLLLKNSLSCATDSSNRDMSIQRNRIRQKVLPALKRATRHIDINDELLKIAEAARAINVRLEAGSSIAYHKAIYRRSLEPFACREWYTPFADPTGNKPEPTNERPDEATSAMRLDVLKKLDPILLHPLLEKSISHVSKTPGPHLSKGLFKAAASLIESGRQGSRVEISGECLLFISGYGLVLVRSRPAREERTVGAPIEVPLPGFAQLPDHSTIRAALSQDREKAAALLANPDPFVEVLDADRVGPIVHIRPRRAGDRFHPLGANGGKKLKGFLIDIKTPAFCRDCLALVCAGSAGHESGTPRGGEIIWVAGLRIGHCFRVTGKTERFLFLDITK